MLMGCIWLGMLCVSIVFAALNGRLGELSAAILSGAGSAVELCISVCGALCLWSGLMELMREAGLASALACLFRPLLQRIYPNSFRNEAIAADISTNFTANLLGLGNAATPAGLRALSGMAAQSGKGIASNEICRLVVMNSASLQLIPATVAAVRGALGAENAFDILPCVWLTSIISVSAGLFTARLLEGKEP